jgi:hypothetical protein
VVDRLESPVNDGPDANGIAGVVATLLTQNFETSPPEFNSRASSLGQ